MNARFYSADTGRFLTQDTYRGNAWEPMSQNLYTYVGNNPINYVDPTGHNGVENEEDDVLPIINNPNSEATKKQLLESILSKTSDEYVIQHINRIIDYCENKGTYEAVNIVNLTGHYFPNDNDATDYYDDIEALKNYTTSSCLIVAGAIAGGIVAAEKAGELAISESSILLAKGVGAVTGGTVAGLVYETLAFSGEINESSSTDPVKGQYYDFCIDFSYFDSYSDNAAFVITGTLGPGTVESNKLNNVSCSDFPLP